MNTHAPLRLANTGSLLPASPRSDRSERLTILGSSTCRTLPPLATSRIEHTECRVFSLDEGADVGSDEGTPVTEAYTVPFKFTGKI
jgi:hypothetical protein